MQVFCTRPALQHPIQIIGYPTPPNMSKTYDSLLCVFYYINTISIHFQFNK
jgi:hypothetical protein